MWKVVCCRQAHRIAIDLALQSAMSSDRWGAQELDSAAGVFSLSPTAQSPVMVGKMRGVMEGVGLLCQSDWKAAGKLCQAGIDTSSIRLHPL